ncbi:MULTISPECIES: anthranilate phosphoribosyltransferase [unclassified Paenibacillus]|uniref:anthranilate phosphoribosyltransferase n=1 Tax=unclassified Paenibacillus TaxID=185978 RepID=UPI0027892DC4|nr:MULTISPECIES: anthranilate phosphoribosyltransferase [unclassified Paenibacillus]MDQ0901537.1 anthranilate phosphoribosyltransferase [Paenibacillus sp. V4I7]MDQ0919960.1 anthranilate phosphoribosyltransferase [Paenibacillus sp. V4I5]
MISLLKEVGRGKRGARDLTYEEASQAAELILTGAATQAQMGAFLVAERIKMESPEELKAFIDALRQRIQTYPIPGSMDCAGPYDGRSRTFIATLPTAFVLAACGLPTTLHGSPSMPPKWGITLSDVLAALEVPALDASREALISAAARTGFLFAPTENWCAPLGELRELRKELGLRTVFNTAEKLLRFTEAPFMAVGVFHGTVFEKITNLLIELGVSHGIVVQGMEGSEDLSVDKRTRTYLIQEGASELFIVDPEIYELMVEVPEIEWTAQLQGETALSVLRGEAELPYLNMVLLNSAVRLWVSKKAGSIEEGIYLARHAIEQGAALQKFTEWTEAIKPVSAT